MTHENNEKKKVTWNQYSRIIYLPENDKKYKKNKTLITPLSFNNPEDVPILMKIYKRSLLKKSSRRRF